MKPSLWFIGALIVAVLLVAVWFIVSPEETSPPLGGGLSEFPTGGSVTPSPSGELVITVNLEGVDTPLTIKDFLHNGTTVEDVQNPGNFYLAGNLGYCLKDGVCPTGVAAANYKVAYTAQEEFFTIALIDEPLGPARLAAEDFLAQTLGVSKQQLCGLKYYVGTTSYVNSVYAGKNLGFSFCPGATALPK